MPAPSRHRRQAALPVARRSGLDRRGRAGLAPFSILTNRMASDRATLSVSDRTEFGSRTTRRLRRSGLVPGVVYGGGNEARHFQVPEREVRSVLLHGGALIDVRFDGSGTTPVVVKEEQRDPVRGSLLHLDLLEVKLDEEIQAEVGIELIGTDDAPGVKEGGVLEHVTHQITIEALPTAIPDSVPADVSGMAIGDTLQLSALTPPEGVKFSLGEGVEPDEVTIATLSPPRVEEEPEPEVEEEAELVGEEGEVPEGAEAAEGEAPAEGGEPEEE
jgi:large subunit ribosomal protein L25